MAESNVDSLQALATFIVILATFFQLDIFTQ